MESAGQSWITGGAGDDTIHIRVGGENDVIDSGSGDNTIIVDNEIGLVKLENHCFPATGHIDIPAPELIELTLPDDKIILRNPELTDLEAMITCSHLDAAEILWKYPLVTPWNVDPPG